MAQRLILVVDDSPDLRLIFKTILESRDYAVVQAKDGAEGVEVAARHHPDMIFMDLMMPGMDGWEATSLIKAFPEGGAIPIVAVTSSEPHRDQVKAAGFCGVIRKPILPPQVVKAAAICMDCYARGITWIGDLQSQASSEIDC